MKPPYTAICVPSIGSIIYMMILLVTSDIRASSVGHSETNRQFFASTPSTNITHFVTIHKDTGQQYNRHHRSLDKSESLSNNQNRNDQEIPSQNKNKNDEYLSRIQKSKDLFENKSNLYLLFWILLGQMLLMCGCCFLPLWWMIRVTRLELLREIRHQRRKRSIYDTGYYERRKSSLKSSLDPGSKQVVINFDLASRHSNSNNGKNVKSRIKSEFSESNMFKTFPM